MTQTYALVGAHYRTSAPVNPAPAKAILQVLPTEAELELRPEPENPYDPDAVAVWVFTSEIPESEYENLETYANGYGWDLETILSKDCWHLGYTPRGCGLAAVLGGESKLGKLSFNAKGQPTVEVG